MIGLVIKHENAKQRYNYFMQSSRSQFEFVGARERSPKGKGNSLYLLLMLLIAVAIFTVAVYHQGSVETPPQQEDIDGPANSKDVPPSTEKESQQAAPFENVKKEQGLNIQQSQLSQQKPKTEPKSASKETKSQYPGYVEVNDILQVGPLRAGELHYPRVPREYWEHRMLSIKALGLNALSVYVFWNLHEIRRGEFDFSSGQRDLTAFLALAAKHGFKVLIRPGPYVCAEWDFGGLPARLLGIPNIKIRSHDPVYEAQVRIYFAALAEVIRPHLRINGGNIVLLQIENQLGWRSKQWQHTYSLKNIWKSLNISTNFYYQDPYEHWQGQYNPGLSLGISGGHNIAQYQNLANSDFFKGKLIFGGEIYAGWLTWWGQGHFDGISLDRYRSHLEILLSNNISFSLYMIHGGTNFGLTAGSNDSKEKKFQPHITSYDYGAPLNEQGSPTVLYHQTKRLFEKYGIKSNEPAPEPMPLISIPSIPLKVQANLLSNLRDPIQLPHLDYFQGDSLQMYHQGIVVYETTLPREATYNLELMAHDYAMIFVDGELASVVPRNKFEIRRVGVKCGRPPCVLRIVVEAMGHLNFGEMQGLDKKGLLHFGDSDRTEFKWKAYRIHLNDTALLDWRGVDSKQDEKAGYPKLLSGTFNVTRVGDTYFDLTPFVKGYIWVNGQLLGRYWNIGPQHSLFCPGVWLKQGENAVHILQMHSSPQSSISTTTKLI